MPQFAARIMDEPKPQMALRRGLEILEVIALQPEGCAFNKMRQELDNVPATTLSRTINVLQEEGWINKENKTGRYHLAPRASTFGRQVTGQLPHEELILPVLTRLAEDADQTAAYFENGGDGVILLGKVEHENSAHMRNTYTSSDKMVSNEFGMVCLAWRSKRDWKKYFKLEPPKEQTYEEFTAVLERIREEYYFCRSCGPKNRWTRIIAPVLMGETEDFAGSIGVTVVGGKLNKTQLARYETMVCEAAGEAARLMGAKA